MHYKTKKIKTMSEVELYLIEEGDNCTIYSLHFLSESETEFEKFVAKFINDADYNDDYSRIAALVSRIARTGALERFFISDMKAR